MYNDQVDLSQQEWSGRKFANKTFDNSDVIERVMTRGTSLYSPNNYSFSPIRAVNPLTKPDNYVNVLSGQQNVDELLARRQMYRGSMSERALEGKSRSTRNIYDKYYKKELRENEKRVWWSDEAQDYEDDWDPWG
jgi:hypothetical protein